MEMTLPQWHGKIFIIHGGETFRLVFVVSAFAVILIITLEHRGQKCH